MSVPRSTRLCNGCWGSSVCVTVWRRVEAYGSNRRVHWVEANICRRRRRRHPRHQHNTCRTVATTEQQQSSNRITTHHNCISRTQGGKPANQQCSHIGSEGGIWMGMGGRRAKGVSGGAELGTPTEMPCMRKYT